MESTNKVRCAECGFLSLREIKTRLSVEVEEWYREAESLEELSGVVRAGYPFCYQGAAHLPSEVSGSIRDKPSDPEVTARAILFVIQDARTCYAFEQWREGDSPKEHAERRDRERREQVETERFKLMLKTQKQSAVVAAIVGLVADAISGPLMDGCSAKSTAKPQQRAVNDAGQ